MACTIPILNPGEPHSAKEDICRYMLKTFPQDVNVTLGKQTVCHMLAIKPGSASTLQWLIEEQELDVNPGQAFLRYNDADEMNRHLSVRLSENAGEEGNSPLHLACFHGRTEAMRVLLEAGANTDVLNMAGLAPPIIREEGKGRVHLLPTEVSQFGPWTHRSRQWMTRTIQVDQVMYDSKGRVKRKMKDAEQAAADKEMKKKIKQLKDKKMPKGDVQFPRDGIDAVIKYMDPQGDGEIELEDMGAVVRAFNRRRAVAKLEKPAREVIRQIYECMNLKKMSIEDVFAIIDKSGDGCVSGVELVEGLNDVITTQKFDPKNFEADFGKELGITQEQVTDIMEQARTGNREYIKMLGDFRTKLEAKSSIKALSKKEIYMVRDYMDTEKDDRISVQELKKAFERAVQSPEHDRQEEQVGIVLGSLEAYMKKRRMRLMQLFEEMDTDNSGTLSVDELRAVLERMCAPTVKGNAVSELREKKAALEKASKERKEEEMRQRKAAADELTERLNKVNLARSIGQRMLNEASGRGTSVLPRPNTSLGFTPGGVKPRDSQHLDRSMTPMYESMTMTPQRQVLTPIRKPIKKIVVKCGICGGDKNSSGCQMYHTVANFNM